MRAHTDRGETPSCAISARVAPPISTTHLYAAALALTIANVAGAFAPHAEATWAIAYPKTIPAGWRVLVAVAAPALAVATAASAARIGARARAAAARLALTPWPWMALLLALHLFLPNTYPYGDAVRFYRFIPGATGPEANAPLSFEVHRALALAFPAHLVAAFSSLAAVGGIIAVPGLFRLARSLFPSDDDRARRALFLAGMAGTGAWQVFVGYVEHYHVQLALIIWGLAFLIEAERDAAPSARTTHAALLLGLAAAWNLSAAWLLPLPALAAFRWGRAAAARALAWSLLPVAATAALLALAWGPATVAASYAGGFHPFATPAAGFVPLTRWLSGAHLLFLLNEAVLVAPIGVALGLGIAGVPRTSARLALFALAALFAWSWNPRLGWAKDWDLFVWPFVAIQALVLAEAVRREPAAPRPAPWAALAGSGAAFSIIHLLSNSALGTPR